MPASAALITGANSGIGKEVARQFAELGAFDTIYLACRNQAKAQSARAELEQAAGKTVFVTVQMDTSDLDSVRTAIASVAAPLQTAAWDSASSSD